MVYKTRAFYRHRFPKAEYAARVALWQTLYAAEFSRYIQARDTVMDIGAGYCEFINEARCAKKIAVDVNPDTKRKAARDVVVLSVDAIDIPGKYDGTIDVVWMSNFLEHLEHKRDVLAVLERSFRLLKPGGTLLVLQPNITLVREQYWDFIDHYIALNGASVQEAMVLAGFDMVQYTQRFLPYTTKSRLPMWPWLIRFYLLIPPAFRPYAGQSFFIAKKR